MTDPMRIRTNNVPRDVLDACELTPRERARFDYLDWRALDEGSDSASFVRYHGHTYDLGEFMRLTDADPDSPLASWHGYVADSVWSGVVIRFVDDGYDTRVVMGWYSQ